MTRNPVAFYGALAALCLLFVGVALGGGAVTERQTAVKLYRGTSIIAASDPKSSVHVPGLTPERCEVMREERWQADARTRTSGTATYKCQVETRAIIGFHAAPPPDAVLSWTAPAKNTDGSPLTDLAGYRISYGTSPTALAQTIQVTGTSYTITELAPGTWYFAVRASTTGGKESAPSNVVSKVIL